MFYFVSAFKRNKNNYVIRNAGRPRFNKHLVEIVLLETFSGLVWPFHLIKTKKAKLSLKESSISRTHR